ncbi:uncharacterized protein [Diadema setosum]|uniref:uncharacterized protein n=1 Tax=Diadema setosum TaxID=31175 RepID=UPI003B39FE8F
MGSSYHNKVYNSGDDSVENDTDNGTSTLDDSTWRSLASVKNNTGMNETRGESMRPNNAPSSASNTMVGDRERGDTEESSYYFKLNPGRASMLADAYEELRIGTKNNASLGRAKNSNTFYAVSEAIGGTSSDAIGAEVNGYEPVVVKDDETGGYQVIDESNDSLRTDADVASSDFRKDYEQVSVPNQRPVPADRPVPAARKNIPPKPQPRIVENVLYKPMNNEVSVKNVLYNPLEEGK